MKYVAKKKVQPIDKAHDPQTFTKMSVCRKNQLVEFILRHFHDQKKPNLAFTSYTLTEMCNFPVTNGEFKGAMLLCGFTTPNPNNTYCHFNVAESSKAIKEWRRGLR